MSIEISHSAEEGTLVHGTSRGDGTNAILKANGFRWFRTLGLWGLPNSRDRQPKLGAIARAAHALRAAGYEVSTNIDTTHRAVAEAEADRSQRATDRAEALDTKADRKAHAAQAAWDAEARASAAVPPDGQPILIGHHSETRHRRSIERARAKLSAAVDAQHAADTAAQRAATAARADAHRHHPVTVKNRIEKMKAEQRKDKRTLDGHSRVVARTATHTYRDEFPPATGEYREQVIARMAQRADEIAYWEQVYADMQAAGTASTYDRTTIAKGDFVKYRGHWYNVVRVNAKSVSVPLFAGAGFTHTIGYHEISGHRRADAAAADAPAAL